MNISRPLHVVTLTLEGDILRVLAVAEKAFTGREIQRAIPGASQNGVWMALGRLENQGIVFSEQAGRAKLYRLNRQHIAAPYIEGLASLRLTLIARLRDEIEEWEVAPLVAVLFGSTARGESNEESDIDILVIRPRAVDADDEQWQAQLTTLQEKTTSWTGNDTRILEYGEDELPSAPGEEPVIDDALNEGIELAGLPVRTLRRRIAGGNK